VASESRTTVRPRDERSCLPRCHPHSACAALIVTDGSGGLPPSRSALPGIAGALRRSLVGPRRGVRRSVRRLPGPFPVVVAPVHTSHRISVPTSRRVLVPFIAMSSIVVACRDGGRAVAARQARGLGSSMAGRVTFDEDVAGLEAGAGADRQCRVAWEPGVRGRAPAQPEAAASLRADDPGVAACAAQAGRRSCQRGVCLGDRMLAERVGFEPTGSCDPALFKSAAIDRSATSPCGRIPRRWRDGGRRVSQPDR
jgi:hypothetical protein